MFGEQHNNIDLEWRLSSECAAQAEREGFALAPKDAPRIAILLYRKHVITNQRYIIDLIRMFEEQGLLPVPGTSVILSLLHGQAKLQCICPVNLTATLSASLFYRAVFINGVEAHTIVRDWLTSDHEIHGVEKGTIVRDSTYKANEAVAVDGIVSTIGFPLVGGPAGSVSNLFHIDSLFSKMLRSHLSFVQL